MTKKSVGTLPAIILTAAIVIGMASETASAAILPVTTAATHEIPAGATEDYSKYANPAIFEIYDKDPALPRYTKSFYNKVRQKFLDGTIESLFVSTIYDKKVLSREAAAARETFLQTISGLSDREKIIGITEFVIKNMDYKANNFNLDSFFLGGTDGQCAHYSLLVLHLCNLAKVPCLFVMGTSPNGGAHAWNIVYTDGKWRGLDATWSRGGRAMVFDSGFKGDYIISDPNGAMFYKEVLVPGSTL